MSKSLSNLSLSKSAIIFGSSLVSLSIYALAANAVPKVNPCPGIYYEEPYNTNRTVPVGCPPNYATKTKLDRPVLPSIYPTPQVTETSLVREQIAIAKVTPQLGQISVRLKNNMQTMVTYQALGETSSRSLQGGEEVLLQNLPLPMTLALNRADGGLVKIAPMSSEKEGVLSISLKEAYGLSDSQLNLLVQSEGQVYAY